MRLPLGGGTHLSWTLDRIFGLAVRSLAPVSGRMRFLGNLPGCPERLWRRSDAPAEGSDSHACIISTERDSTGCRIRHDYQQSGGHPLSDELHSNLPAKHSGETDCIGGRELFFRRMERRMFRQQQLQPDHDRKRNTRCDVRPGSDAHRFDHRIGSRHGYEQSRGN